MRRADKPSGGIRRNLCFLLSVGIWVLLGLATCLLLMQYQLGVLHAAYVPFLFLMLLTTVFVISVVPMSLNQWMRGHRWSGAFGIVSAFFPLVLFVSPLVYAQQQWSKRMVPVGIPGRFAMMVGSSLMECQAQWFYPNRVESKNIAMFYRDLNSVDDDLRTMEQHVAALEEKLNTTFRSKIHWVRGSLLGQGRVSFLGLALGSTQSPANSLDRHELAHAALTQVRIASADPPMVLHEGWAESQSGLDSVSLAEKAIDARRRNPTRRIAELFDRETYRLDAGLAYTYGGAFVDFLLREFSTEAFVTIYNRWHVATSADDFQEVYGVSLDTLESMFWSQAERMVKTENRRTDVSVAR